ncbi:Gfo/Idh/MocA family protein [Cesiribacter andamanensis]|uniref:Glucose--fructose oxidoreductase n=1 Tax=Cesiribacter andamanensis AMV16 TaxID=1279009 RepID=M7P1C5_9BACT|nr:Gfo/Idh/MocA family oxidoreductase [Cesiribacter andamanensis]EMR04414.1 Glucose--fructose oxidoreductase precursor [Cesiribacter andamanensis AMV16]
MKLNWGVLGAAKIAREKVIPSMAHHPDFQVLGLASRSLEKAKATAAALGILKAYGSYEELIADPDIHIIYNPLPNHLHVEYTLKCIEAGKHVLCEKPIALTAADVEKLIEARNRKGVVVGEAFMVRSHPQWIKAREMVQGGVLGKVTLVQGQFSYFNANPDNIRNIEAYGGGALWDIGCYPLNTTRFVLGEEPLRVAALLDFDSEFGTDVLSSVLLQFPSAQLQFSVSTQLVPHQRMQFFGQQKSLEILIPFNAPKDRPCLLRLNDGDIFREKEEVLETPLSDQYRLQAEAFTKAVLKGGEAPVPLEDALANTRALEAIFRAAKEGRWVEIPR